MARPAGPTDYTRRLKAFELYAAGVKKADIASELGVSRPCIGNWASKDKWQEKIEGIVNQADAALTFSIGNEVADALKHLRTGVAQRIRELESLCQPSNAPAARLGAIKAWLELAGLKRAMPNPGDPTTPKSLELIEDLLHNELGRSSDRPTVVEDLLHDRTNLGPVLERTPSVGITPIVADSSLPYIFLNNNDDLPAQAPDQRETGSLLSLGSSPVLSDGPVLSRSIDDPTLEG